MELKQMPLMARHLKPIRHIANNDFLFDDVKHLNLTPTGEMACTRSTKPYTNAQTPSHMIPSGYTPSGGWKPARSVPSKMDRRIGK